MKKLLLILILCITTLSLAACGSGDGAPEGMQLVYGNDSCGYKFYAPEEWIVANHDGYAVAYASSVNITSVILAEAEAPAGSIQEYIAEELAKMPFEVTAGEIKSTNFGNAQKAYSCVYDYEYRGRQMRAMQIFATYNGSFYIFSYNSYNEPRTEDITYYDYYFEKAKTCIDNVVFSEKGESLSAPIVYEKNDKGNIIASDRTLSGFTLAVPEDYRVDYSSGIVSVTRGDGANINLTKATYTGVTLDEYWRVRVENLKAIVDKVKDENGKIITEEVTNAEGKTENVPISTLKVTGEHIAVSLPDCDWARAYEYSYTLFGVTYKVYQVLIVNGYDGFVFTYSATEDVYDLHIEEAKNILSDVEF